MRQVVAVGAGGWRSIPSSMASTQSTAIEWGSLLGVKSRSSGSAATPPLDKAMVAASATPSVRFRDFIVRSRDGVRRPAARRVRPAVDQRVGQLLATSAGASGDSKTATHQQPQAGLPVGL